MAVALARNVRGIVVKQAQLQIGLNGGHEARPEDRETGPLAMLQINETLCPVPADMLAQLYRTDPAEAAGKVVDLSEGRRADLALFCYSKAHLRPLAMAIAATCGADQLTRRASNAGIALAAQCRQTVIPNARISLAGTRH